MAKRTRVRKRANKAGVGRWKAQVLSRQIMASFWPPNARTSQTRSQPCRSSPSANDYRRRLRALQRPLWPTETDVPTRIWTDLFYCMPAVTGYQCEQGDSNISSEAVERIPNVNRLILAIQKSQVKSLIKKQTTNRPGDHLKLVAGLR
jgi:hypothetical protein